MSKYDLKCPGCGSVNVSSKNTKLKNSGVGAALVGTLGAIALGPIGLLGGAAIGALAGKSNIPLLEYSCKDCGKVFTVCSKCNGHVDKMKQIGNNAHSWNSGNRVAHYNPGIKCPLCGYVFKNPTTTYTEKK